MLSTRLLAGLLADVAFFGAIPTAMADVYPVIVIGKVVMPDGSAPPFIASIERECTDFSTANGPQTDKKGQWVWNINVDVFEQRSCVFRAHHDGYASTEIDASALNVHYLDKTVHVPDILLQPKVPDPYTIHTSVDNFPSKAKAPFERAIKDVDLRQYEAAILEFRDAVTAAPKFADGWHALGVVYANLGKLDLAKDAFTKAIDANPKLLTAYVTLTRTCLQIKNWQCAADSADRLTRLDLKRQYYEIYLHQAVARFKLKDVPGAEQSVNDMIRLDVQHKISARGICARPYPRRKRRRRRRPRTHDKISLNGREGARRGAGPGASGGARKTRGCRYQPRAGASVSLNIDCY